MATKVYRIHFSWIKINNTILLLLRQVCPMVKHSREKTKKYLYEIGYEVSCYWFINQYTNTRLPCCCCCCYSFSLVVFLYTFSYSIRYRRLTGNCALGKKRLLVVVLKSSPTSGAFLFLFKFHPRALLCLLPSFNVCSRSCVQFPRP